MPAKVIIVPGYGGSPEGHWQTEMEKYFDTIRVEQENWNEPTWDQWSHGLEEAIAKANSDIILVAHSLGCVLSTRWATEHKQLSRRIKAALLVAPADIEETAGLPEALQHFSHISDEALGFPSVVVLSENDPYCTLDRGTRFAKSWGSQILNIGMAGHINIASGHGHWDLGRQIITSLL